MRVKIIQSNSGWGTLEDKINEFILKIEQTTYYPGDGHTYKYSIKDVKYIFDEHYCYGFIHYGYK